MSTLVTNLKHIISEAEYNKAIAADEKVVILAGRMGPMCVPVYDTCEQLEKENPNIKFYDMLFDIPEARLIRELPECQGFMGLPFTVYYVNGKVVKATTSIQSKEQIQAILDEHFSA